MSDQMSDDAFRAFLPGQKQDDDAGLLITFFVKPKLMGLKSTEAGRPIYEDREYVEIRVKGQPNNVPVEEVNETHKKRWPLAYAAFKVGLPAPIIGTPIENLPGIGPSAVLTYKALGIRTVEDVVSMAEPGLQKMGMGARELQRQCKAYLERSTVVTVELSQENATLKSQVAELQQQMADLMAAVKPKRGRPRNTPKQPEAMQ